MSWSYVTNVVIGTTASRVPQNQRRPGDYPRTLSQGCHVDDELVRNGNRQSNYDITLNAVGPFTHTAAMARLRPPLDPPRQGIACLTR